MNRRDFMKSSATAAVAAPAMAALPALGKAPILTKLLPTPKTVEQLYYSINEMFKNQGEFDRAYIEVEYLPVGTSRIVFKTYFPRVSEDLPPNEVRFHREGFEVEIDSYYSNPVDPVLALWKMALNFKADIRNNWTMEQMADFGEQGVKQGTMIWWRHRPELVETKNGLFTVYMRAEFA